jgi:hypothetical protein
MHAMLQSITSTMQTLALSPLDEKIGMKSAQEDMRTEKLQGLGKEYQGSVSAENALASGEDFAFCDSILLKLVYDTATQRYSGTINVDSIMKRVVGYDNPADVPQEHILCEWVNTVDHEVHYVEGVFNANNNMLTLADTGSTGDESNLKKYFLVLHEDRLIGMQQALQPRLDLEDSSSTEPLNLMRVR